MPVIRLVLGSLETNCYIVKDEAGDKCLIIDAADEVEIILQKLNESGCVPEVIVATHGHPDHIGAVQKLREITGAAFAIHKEDVMTQRRDSLHNLLSANLMATPDYFIKDGDELSIGNIKLQVIHTPGHTRGSICLLGKECLFSGDTLFKGSVGRTDMGGNFSQLTSSLRKLLTLPDFTTVYPGHGPSTTIGIEKVNNPFVINLP